MSGRVYSLIKRISATTKYRIATAEKNTFLFQLVVYSNKIPHMVIGNEEPRISVRDNFPKANLLKIRGM